MAVYGNLLCERDRLDNLTSATAPALNGHVNIFPLPYVTRCGAVTGVKQRHTHNVLFAFLWLYYVTHRSNTITNNLVLRNHAALGYDSMHITELIQLRDTKRWWFTLPHHIMIQCTTHHLLIYIKRLWFTWLCNTFYHTHGSFYCVTITTRCTCSSSNRSMVSTPSWRISAQTETMCPFETKNSWLDSLIA